MATLVPPELLVAVGAALTVIGLLAAAIQRPCRGATMSRTPALVLLGLLLVVLAIPLAFSLAPFVIGVIVLIVAGRRAHRALGDPPVATAAA